MTERELFFSVDGQRIVHSGETPIPVGDTVNYLVAVFTLGAEWDGLDILVVFHTHTGKITEKMGEDRRCRVPESAVEFPNRSLTVGLIGHGADGYRLTTDEAEVQIDRSCYRPGETPAPPAPDLYAAFIADTRAAKAGVNAASASAQEAELAAERAAASAKKMEEHAGDAAASAARAERIAQSVRDDADAGRFDGNVMYATFDIEPETMELVMETPDAYAGPRFTVNEKGEMEVEI